MILIVLFLFNRYFFVGSNRLISNYFESLYLHFAYLSKVFVFLDNILNLSMTKKSQNLGQMSSKSLYKLIKYTANAIYFVLTLLYLTSLL
jgi:hypothetical protein